MDLKTGIWASRRGCGPRKCDFGLEAGIWTLRQGFEPQDWDLGFKARIWALRLGFGPQGWDLGLKAGIWALRLGLSLERGGTYGGDGEEEEEEGGEISPLCESIGHRPLRGRCPKRTKMNLALIAQLNI